jgi:hypothetical protein
MSYITEEGVQFYLGHPLFFNYMTRPRTSFNTH